jgi:hypothetical protein
MGGRVCIHVRKDTPSPLKWTFLGFVVLLHAADAPLLGQAYCCFALLYDRELPTDRVDEWCSIALSRGVSVVVMISVCIQEHGSSFRVCVFLLIQMSRCPDDPENGQAR